MDLLADLQAILRAGQVTANETMREHHSRDESYHAPVLPDVVVFAESTEDVVQVLRYAHEHDVPVTPFAVGSSLEGHTIPVQAGISLDLMRMNRILEVRPDDFLVRVQPGVTKDQLNAALARHGLFFTVDPGADASMGGMAATNASGTTTVRYGVMRDQVRALEVVLADGTVMHTGTLAAKSSSGYHLTGLLVGSEGTLGVFTELWLRVYGLPEKVMAARAAFPDVDACVRASTAIMGAGVPVARMELADPHILRGVNRFKGTSFPEVPTLFLEFHGSSSSLTQDVETARALLEDEGCVAYEMVATEDERRRLWDARHVAATAFTAQFAGKRHLATDVCVPLSRLAEAVAHARQWIDASDIDGGIVGHVGDGNFHAILAVDPDNASEVAEAYRIHERMVEHALALGGTCTGEHGVGLGKRKFQVAEHSDSLAMMRQIKCVFDPKGILNPGKLVSE